MGKSILYLQANEEDAENMKSCFEADDVAFYAASSAQDAFEVMAANDITVVFVGYSISDMKQFDFLKKCIREYPDTMVNVCVDIADSKMVSNISAIKQVKKIYIDSWDKEDIYEGLMATVDQACIYRDRIERKHTLEQEEEQFENTLNSLKDALLKQRFSYHKLEKILKPYLETMIKISGEKQGNSNSASDELFYNFMRYSCEKMLRIMTTTKFDADSLNGFLLKDLQSAIPKSGRIELKGVTSCVFGNPDRDKLACLIFNLWFITLYQSYRLKTGTVNIDSFFLDSALAKFEIVAEGTVNEGCPQRIHDYVETILNQNVLGYTEEGDGERITYSFTFQTR